MGKGLLLSLFDSAGGDERAIGDWLGNTYLPELMARDGFERGRLWTVVDNPKLVIAAFDVASVDALKAHDLQLPPGSEQVLSFEGEQINPGDQMSPAEADGMLLVASNATPDFESEYSAWYDEEHLPALRGVPGTLSARRFRAIRSSRRFLSLYHLNSPDVQASPAWKKAVDTPWSSKVRPRVKDRVRFVCRAYT